MKKLVLILFALFSFAADASVCRLCKMEVSEKSVTKFEAVYKNEVIQLCSFSCATRLKRKNPGFLLNAFDFLSHERVLSDHVFLIVKSKKIENVTEVAMPPAVIAFKDKEAAQAMLKKLGDGEIVKGFDAALAVYE